MASSSLNLNTNDLVILWVFASRNFQSYSNSKMSFTSLPWKSKIVFFPDLILCCEVNNKSEKAEEKGLFFQQKNVRFKILFTFLFSQTKHYEPLFQSNWEKMPICCFVLTLGISFKKKFEKWNKTSLSVGFLQCFNFNSICQSGKFQRKVAS